MKKVELNPYVDITSFSGEGYMPLVDYRTWRVAVLRFIDSLLPERIEFIECHLETDEVFVLLEGTCTLLIGVPVNGALRIEPLEMEPLKLYNIRKGVYHSHFLSEDATVLIVENQDTGDANSHRVTLDKAQKSQITRAASERTR